MRQNKCIKNAKINISKALIISCYYCLIFNFNRNEIFQYTVTGFEFSCLVFFYVNFKQYFAMEIIKTETNKSKPCKIVNNFKYWQVNILKNGDISWQCAVKQCACRIKTNFFYLNSCANDE